MCNISTNNNLKYQRSVLMSGYKFLCYYFAVMYNKRNVGFILCITKKFYCKFCIVFIEVSDVHIIKINKRPHRAGDTDEILQPLNACLCVLLLVCVQSYYTCRVNKINKFCVDPIAILHEPL